MSELRKKKQSKRLEQNTNKNRNGDNIKTGKALSHTHTQIQFAD